VAFLGITSSAVSRKNSSSFALHPLARGQYRGDARLGTQGKLWSRHHLQTRDQREAETPRHRRQYQNHLLQRERLADTAPRAAAEREVGVTREALCQIVPPAFRAERLRLLEEARITLHHPRAEYQGCPAPHRPAAHHTVSQRLPADDVRRRI